MDRREFLARMAGLGFVAVAGGASGPILVWSPRAAAGSKPEPTLAVAKGKNHAQLVDRVMAALGGMERFVKKGARVFVKPNICCPRGPEMAACTNPDVVKRVVELCLRAGAAEVVVGDRAPYLPMMCYLVSGITPAIKSIGDKRARVEEIDERRFLTVNLAHGKRLKKWSFYEPILKADVLINLPVAKHHSRTELTLSMKNMMGAVGGDRGQLHPGLDQNIADLNTVLKAHLIVMDGTRIMTENGPTGGSTDYVKINDTVAAGVDPVAIDALATGWFGRKPSDIGYIKIGHRMGLGEMDLAKVKIINC